MNEAKAINLCIKHRDPIGFEYLVKKYRREALFHARIFLGNDEDAADACQESFVKAFKDKYNEIKKYGNSEEVVE